MASLNIMTTTWGILTIGTVPVSITAIPKCTKLSFQVAPGATGGVKIGAAGLTADNATPGTWLNSSAALNADSTLQAGGMWTVESHEDVNSIYPPQYLVHGTHAGDVVMWETHVN